MKRLLAYILILFCCVANAAGQDVVSGRVSDNVSGEILPGANVLLKAKNGIILDFRISDDKGLFDLPMPKNADSLTLEISLLGYKNYSAPILSAPKERLEILMEEGSIQLKDVEVKAERISEKGDTVTYRVASFAQEQDQTIGDVLRRMPGIEVMENGRIQYQGLDINKFYIEGSDLLGGKYGVATNGISHEDIGAVEVMENHQPLQVLRGISFSDQAAINLKLKENSKATWLVKGHAGAGWSAEPKGAMWDGEAFAMTVFPKFQTITTIKSNNVGTNLNSQVTDFLSSRRNTELSSYFSLDLPAAPSFKENRTLFNKSHLFSTNNLWNINHADLRFQFDYSSQSIKSRGSNLTTYFLENGPLTVLDNRNGKLKENHLNGSLNLEINQKNYYLSNNLKTELFWDKSDLEITGDNNVWQKADIPNYFVSNNLKLIKRFGKNLITFSSVDEWESMPQSLAVTLNNRKQQTKDAAFYTNKHIDYGFILDGFRISLESGVDGYVRRLRTSSLAKDSTDEESFSLFNLYLSPKIEYSFRCFDFALQYPIKLYSSAEKRFSQSPSFNMKWRPNAMFSLSLTGGLGEQPISFHNLHRAEIMSDYRTFAKGAERLYFNSRKNISSRVSYRHSPNGVFANLMFMKSWLRSPYMSCQEFEGQNITHSYAETPASSQTTTVMGNFSKTLDFMRGAISLNGSYNRMTSTVLSENLPTSCANTILSVGPRLNGNLSDFANFSYEFSYRRTMLGLDGQKSQVTNNFSHSFNLYVSHLKSLSCDFSGEYYNNQLSASKRKDMLFLDMNLTWNIRDRVQLQASLSNILNKKSYSYKTFSTLSAFESERQIRGREFMITISLTR